MVKPSQETGQLDQNDVIYLQIQIFLIQQNDVIESLMLGRKCLYLTWIHKNFFAGQSFETYDLFRLGVIKSRMFSIIHMVWSIKRFIILVFLRSDSYFVVCEVRTNNQAKFFLVNLHFSVRFIEESPNFLCVDIV